MRVAVIGGAGYIGSHVSKSLVDTGDEVIVVDKNLWSENVDSLESYSKRVTIHECDILSDWSVLKECLSGCDSVIHLAAYAYVGDSVERPLEYYENNVTGTCNLLRAMKETGVGDLLFSSTCATYGVHDSRIREDHQQDPVNPYGRTKLACEWMIRDAAAAGELQSFGILRYFNVAGADHSGLLGECHYPEPHVIPRLLHAADSGEVFEVYGDDYDTRDGTAERDYIHVNDLARYHVETLSVVHSNENVVCNLGTGSGVTVKELVSVVERVVGKRVNVEYKPRRPGDPPSLVADPSRSWRMFGKPSRSSIENIVATAYEWHKRSSL